jgi:ABC-type multidrug transport system fused ATPase/permease subunit
MRDADNILVVRHGVMIEQGNHAALIAGDRLYARLYRRNFSSIDDAA